ncbi:hypothetical protein TeGR_g11795, partial [Tetraparma gracilis]
YGEAFELNNIDGESLLNLRSRGDLKPLGVLPMHAKKVIDRVKVWRCVGVPVHALQ